MALAPSLRQGRLSRRFRYRAVHARLRTRTLAGTHRRRGRTWWVGRGLWEARWEVRSGHSGPRANLEGILWLEEPEALGRVAGTDSTYQLSCVTCRYASSLCTSGGWVVVRATSTARAEPAERLCSAGARVAERGYCTGLVLALWYWSGSASGRYRPGRAPGGRSRDSVDWFTGESCERSGERTGDGVRGVPSPRNRGSNTGKPNRNPDRRRCSVRHRCEWRLVAGGALPVPLGYPHDIQWYKL